MDNVNVKKIIENMQGQRLKYKLKNYKVYIVGVLIVT